MPATYELISTYTMPSNATSVTLSSIPSTYTDLVVVGNYKVVNSGGVGFCFRFNSDTATNYEFMGYYGNGSTNNGNYGQPYNMSYVAIALDNPLTTTVAYVNDYATTGKYRTILAHSGNSGFNGVYTGNWNNSSDAINSITFLCDGGSNITAGGIFTLYGITKA